MAKKKSAWHRPKEKEPKRKPKYGMLSCVAYLYRMVWEHDRSLVLAGAGTVPAELAASALALYLPAALLRTLEGAGQFSAVALVILGLILAELLIELANKTIRTKKDYSKLYLCSLMTFFKERRKLDRDFFLDYDPEVKKLDERAEKASVNNHARGVNFLMEFSLVVSIVLKFFLFGSVLSLLNPWLILFILACCAANIPMSAWERSCSHGTQDKRNAVMKKLNYLTIYLGRDFKYGKDIRIYGLKGYLSLLVKKLAGEYVEEQRLVERRISIVQIADFLAVLIRDGLVYAWLISRAVAGEIDAARFVVCFTAATELAEVCMGIRWWWSCACEGAMQISDYRENLEFPDQMNRGSGIPLPEGAFSIEFKNVAYRYPGTEENVLEHISFRLEAGEKLALVGINGAGKTTLTRLICGLILPTEGEVLIDGHGPKEYSRDALYGLFGLVPQNYHLLPVSIARNVACTDEGEAIDEEKLAGCIELAGLTEKVASLPLGLGTPLNRQVNPDGAELSGGEIQKLLLARLLYRRPGCMILDEPTAALDPIAEDRMYRRYDEIAGGSTAIFISHRLASTRFCDRIFLLDGGTIAEAGTHEELIAAGKKYRELFDVQSRYYKEGVSI